MRPLLTYFGGKQRLAKWIVSKFPDDYQQRHYIEPFFGGGAVFFQKEPSKLETINDLNKNLYRLYRAFKEHPKEIKEKFKGYLYIEEDFKRSKQVYNGEIKPKDEIDFAYCVFVSIAADFMKDSSSKGSFNVLMDTKGRRSTAQAIQNKISIFQDIQNRLKSVNILNRDALKVIKLAKNQKNVLMYLDPPYIETSQKYKNTFNKDDMIRMIEALKSVKFKFLISCYLNKKLTIPKEWHLHTKKITKSLHRPKGPCDIVTEALFTNYETTKQISLL